MRKLRSELEIINKRQDEIIIEISKYYKRKLIKCNLCKKRFKVSTITLLDKHYYEEPTGCTGGDYYTHGEYAFKCPKCNIINRLLGLSKHHDGKSMFTEKTIFTRELLNAFKDTKIIYEAYPSFINNYD